MKTLKNIRTTNRPLFLAIFLLRLALAATFLSAVFSRLGLWGSKSSGWEGFLEYTAQVNSFAPAGMIPFLAVSATVLETTFGILLLIGYKVRYVAYGAAVLTLFFALAMGYSFGIKDPLDYSVFVDSAAAFLLANVASSGRWSADEYLNRK
ncbi:DoxX family protein [Sinomicrobium kalidii]|uniref:DoxX family protein n=1 Tax=Sinomicrobium kalidii TaxID=2900738 RepID=UPI001E3451AC|nr:DoxX family protein [Sinomicrobium kalidii]UGU16777.1 DoxX family protein [Sinomicrobium kalidii]